MEGCIRDAGVKEERKAKKRSRKSVDYLSGKAVAVRGWGTGCLRPR